jgi:hypothetical protein
VCACSGQLAKSKAIRKREGTEEREKKKGSTKVGRIKQEILPVFS